MIKKTEAKISLLAGTEGSGKTFLLKKKIIETLVNDDNTNIIIMASDENFNEYNGIMYSVINSDNENFSGAVFDVTAEDVMKNCITLSFEDNKRVVLIRMPSLSHNKEMEQKFCNIYLRTVIALVSQNMIDGKETALYIDSADTIIHSGITNRLFLERMLKRLKQCSCSAYISLKNGLSDFVKYGILTFGKIVTDYFYTYFSSAEEERKYCDIGYACNGVKPKKLNRYEIKNAVDFQKGYEDYMRSISLADEEEEKEKNRMNFPFGSIEDLKTIMD